MEEEEKIPGQTAKEDEVSENISPPETIEQNETQIETSGIITSDIEKMEVHQHPKVEKKNFKEYFPEYIVLTKQTT